MTDSEGTDEAPDRHSSGLRTASDVTSTALVSLLPGPIRRNYLLKFGLGLLVVMLLISLTGINTIAATTDTLDEQISDQLVTETKRESEDIEDWRAQHARWINALSKARVMQQDNPTAISIALQQEDDAPDAVRSVHYVNLSSTEVIASSNVIEEGTVLANEGVPWAQKELPLPEDNSVYASEVYKKHGIPVMAFVTRVSESRHAGLVAVARQNQFFNTIDQNREDRFVTVVNETGHIVMDRRGEKFLYRQYGTDGAPQVRKNAMQGNTTFLETAPNQENLDRKYVAAYTRVGDTNWTVISHAAKEEVYLVRTEIRSKLVQLLGISIAGLTLIGIIFAGGTVRSINRLARKVKELEEGNLDVELHTRRDDEIGQLYDGFDSMRISLQDRIEELSEAVRAEEEMRKELSQANRQLKDQRVITSVLNRLLRHNLRNSLTSILLRSQKLADSVDDPQREDVEAIKDVSQRLMRRAEKSRAIEDLIERDPDTLSLVDVSEEVSEITSVFTEEYQHAVIDTDVPEMLYVRGGEGISFILENLVENAIEHNDNPEPSVEIRATLVTADESQWVEIVVADDGPGIPEMEIDVLEKGEETPLEHSSGIGLWLINWLTAHLNGEVHFDEREPRGSRVSIRLPRPDTEEIKANPRLPDEVPIH